MSKNRFQNFDAAFDVKLTNKPQKFYRVRQPWTL